MIGETLSRYRILSKLGAGGMGEVYLAEDTELGREVAVKVLPERLAGNQERLERFRREARVVAALNHPNIVTVFNVEEVAGKRILVMEHVGGRSLDRSITADGLPLATVFDIAIPIAQALTAAHERGITHRDLKPSNVMLDDTGPDVRVKVLDFGLAKLTADTPLPEAMETQAETELQPSTLTGAGTVMGTAPYMSPEQLKGEAVDSRSDIFSFGILLYEMVAGRRPFQGETGLELASSILKDVPSSVVDLRDDVPRQLGRIIQHCLEKDPERRFQSAKDVRNELEELRQEIDSGEVEMSGATRPMAEPAPSSVDKRVFVAMAAASAFIALASLVFFSWLIGRDDGPSPEGETIARAGRPTVAVLPFRNLGADGSVDYLRLAVPDEIVTALSRSPDLAIRPFSSTSGYAEAGLDPLDAGRELGVVNVITGQYFQEGDQLSLTLEAIDVDRHEVVWRDNVIVSAQELLTLRAGVGEMVRRELLPRLGSSEVEISSGTQPTSEEAYDLYLRSFAMVSDAEPNNEALVLLERAAELDPGYAPIWAELGIRYYYRGNYGFGTDEDYDLAVMAARRALELDPELIDPAVRLITVSTERGHLEEAWDAAERLVAQRPEEPRAYFARAYVQRYGGALDGAVEDCDTALSMDPRNRGFRSCGITNSLAGRYDRALRFLALDPASGLALDNTAVTLLRQGQDAEALEVARGADAGLWQVVIPYMEGQPITDLGARAVVDGAFSQRDSEQQYWAGSLMAWSGRYGEAIELLTEAITRGFCSYPFLETDPLLEGLRGDPASAEDYAALEASGRACHEAFLAYAGG